MSRYIVGQGRTYIRANNSAPGKIDIGETVTSFLAGRGVQVVDDGQQRFRHQRKTASAGFGIERRALIAPERIDGDDQKCG